MKKIFTLLFCAASVLAACSDDDIAGSNDSNNSGEPTEEIRPVITNDTRGMVISYDSNNPDMNALISWKWMKDDPEDAAYDIYRRVDDGAWEKLNTAPIATSTNYRDVTFSPTVTSEP